MCRNSVLIFAFRYTEFDEFVGSPPRAPKQLSKIAGTGPRVAGTPRSPLAPARRPDPPTGPATPATPPCARPALRAPRPGPPGGSALHVRLHVSLPAGLQPGTTHAPAAGESRSDSSSHVTRSPQLPSAPPRRGAAGMRSAANVTGPGAGGGGPGPRAPGAREDSPVLLPPKRSAQKSGGQKGARRGASGSRAGKEREMKETSNPRHPTRAESPSCSLKQCCQKGGDASRVSV